MFSWIGNASLEEEEELVTARAIADEIKTLSYL
jgi:hypothetical protein